MIEGGLTFLFLWNKVVFFPSLGWWRVPGGGSLVEGPCLWWRSSGIQALVVSCWICVPTLTSAAELWASSLYDSRAKVQMLTCRCSLCELK